MQERVGAKEDEDQAQKNTRDYNGNFYAVSFCDADFLWLTDAARVRVIGLRPVQRMRLSARIVCGGILAGVV
jgi:hypothetical protein